MSSTLADLQRAHAAHQCESAALAVEWATERIRDVKNVAGLNGKDSPYAGIAKRLESIAEEIRSAGQPAQREPIHESVDHELARAAVEARGES